MWSYLENWRRASQASARANNMIGDGAPPPPPPDPPVGELVPPPVEPDPPPPVGVSVGKSERRLFGAGPHARGRWVRTKDLRNQ